MCQSCLMPFDKDPLGDKRESSVFCSYCFKNGRLCYEGTDIKEFKRAMINAIVGRGESKLKAYFFAFMAGFAPRWRQR